MPHFVKAPDGTYHTTTQPYVKTPANVWAPMSKFFTKVNRTVARTVSNKALTSDVATLTTSVAHGFSIGDFVRVTGVDAVFNGDYTITAVASTTFSYARTNADVTSAAATGSARSEYWQEIWPLVPGPATSLALSQSYSSDRIEWTFSWVAPSTGAPATSYVFTVRINGTPVYSTTVAAPTVSVALTNGGVGWQSYAGAAVTFDVTPQSASGAGPTSTSSSYTAAQLPPPADPTSFAVTLNGGDLYETWTHTGGNTLSDFELQVNRNNTIPFSVYIIGKATSVSVSHNPWSGLSVNGGLWTARVRARGPGGVSGWVTVSGSIPADVAMSDYRFLSGQLRANFTRGANTTLINFYIESVSGDGSIGSFSPDGSSASASGVYTATDSSSWDRDNSTKYRIITQPSNAFGTARAVALGWCRKIPNPIIVHAVSNDTWRNAGWRTDDAGSVYQGWTSSGLNYGYAFYGDQFYDNYNPTRLGYLPNVSSTRIFLARSESSGSSSSVAPRLWLHTAANTAEANNGAWAGGVDVAGFTFSTNGWRDLPPEWGSYLMTRYNAWKGLGVYHPAANSSSPYMRFVDYTGFVFGSGSCWDVEITHDG